MCVSNRKIIVRCCVCVCVYYCFIFSLRGGKHIPKKKKVDVRINAISKFIEEKEPTVIALQEVLFFIVVVQVREEGEEGRRKRERYNWGVCFILNRGRHTKKKRQK